MIYEIGILSGFVSMFLNYCIGKPGGEFSPYEIFSKYTVWLSLRRLKNVDLLDGYMNQYNENMVLKKKKYEIKQFHADFDKIIYNAAEPFFTWERAVGMCSICTGFWISLVIGLIFTSNILQLVEIIVISHITIRIVNKIL